jgi:hypothetical protein
VWIFLSVLTFAFHPCVENVQVHACLSIVGLSPGAVVMIGSTLLPSQLEKLEHKLAGKMFCLSTPAGPPVIRAHLTIRMLCLKATTCVPIFFLCQWTTATNRGC